MHLTFMPYEQNFDYRPTRGERDQPRNENRNNNERRQQDNRRNGNDRWDGYEPRQHRGPEGSRYDHDYQDRGDRHNDYDRSQPRGDYGRDPGTFSYGRQSEYYDGRADRSSFSTSRERQNPSAFQGGLGPGSNRYEGDYRGGRGHYFDEDQRWRRGHEADRPDSRRFQDPYDRDDRPARERPSGYGAPGERVRQINDQYGHDSYDGSSQSGRYRDDNRRTNDDYPGRDRARDDRDGRYHYDDDNDRGNHRRR